MVGKETVKDVVSITITIRNEARIKRFVKSFLLLDAVIPKYLNDIVTSFSSFMMKK